VELGEPNALPKPPMLGVLVAVVGTLGKVTIVGRVETLDVIIL
jgi:hypothetical protein